MANIYNKAQDYKQFLIAFIAMLIFPLLSFFISRSKVLIKNRYTAGEI
jgi:hypothetical protein